MKDQYTLKDHPMKKTPNSTQYLATTGPSRREAT